MESRIRAVKYFLSSQHFSDGILTTVSVLLPALILSYLGFLEIGFLLSLGALAVSISDTPGPIVHKRNGMLTASLLIFITALVTSCVRVNPILMAVEIAIFCFIFSMLAVYGNRAATVGVAALLVMITTMGQEIEGITVLNFSLLIMAGGIWYTVLSLLFNRIRPYMQIKQALGDCIHEVAEFLRIKSHFYNPQFDLEKEYHQLVTQQIKVSEKQDIVRELLFKSRLLVQESTETSRMLLLTFVDLVDLYEQIMSINYDYAILHKRYEKTGILENISTLIAEMGNELDVLGLAIQTNKENFSKHDFRPQLENIRIQIESLESQTTAESHLPLRKVYTNLFNVMQRINFMSGYFVSQTAQPEVNLNEIDYKKFISHQDFNIKKLRDNLNFNSVIFKYSFRVALVCLFGFVLTNIFPLGHHSYWVLLTIIVILKPAFSLTKQRNKERLLGTLSGGVIGILILFLFPDPTIRLVLLIISTACTFIFLRSNYIVSVFFMTPFILIMFSFMGGDNMIIVQERITDTLIGSIIAFSASYLIFPSWESQGLQNHMKTILKANYHYLNCLADTLAGKNVSTENYKVARKDVYVQSANLSAAFQRMLSEPKKKQLKSKEVHKFVVLNHILSSYIAAAVSLVDSEKQNSKNQLKIQQVGKSMAMLKESIMLINPAEILDSLNIPDKDLDEENTQEIALGSEQLGFIQNVSHDIRKITELILKTE